MKDGNPANKQNWALVCSACGAEYQDTETVDLVTGHWQQEHADLDEVPSFNTVWVGKGPAPKGHRLRGGRGRGSRW